MPAQDSDLYDDSPAAAPGADPAENAEPKADEGSETFIAPKSAFTKELKPGDKCDVEVVRVHEDSIEFKGCAGGDDHDDMPGEKPEAAAPEGGEMRSMLE
jgi:hypothetical protein